MSTTPTESPAAPRARGMALHVLAGSTLAIGLVLLGAPRETGSPGWLAEGDDAGSTLVRIGDETLTAAQFEVRWNELLSPETRRFHASRGGPRSYLDEIVDEILLAREARRRGVDERLVVREAVRTHVAHALSRPLLAEEVREGAIAETEVRAYFDAHVAEWSRPLRVEVSEIVVRTEGDPVGARAEAEGIRQRALSGEDFAALARAHSDAPTSRHGGLVGWVVAGQFFQAYEAAALSLSPGEVSELVETSDGFAVLRASAREESQGPTFDEKRDAIRDLLLEEDPGALQRKYRLLVERLREEESVGVDWDALEKLQAEGRLRP